MQSSRLVVICTRQMCDLMNVKSLTARVGLSKFLRFGYFLGQTLIKKSLLKQNIS